MIAQMDGLDYYVGGNATINMVFDRYMSTKYNFRATTQLHLHVYVQILYEKKLITYPRTDIRYLIEDMIVSTVNNILGKNDFDTKRLKVVFNSKKVTDHHAIIPTIASLKEEISELPFSEAKIYLLILDKFHDSVGYHLVENTIKIVAEIDGFTFTTSGKVVKDEGFSKYLKEYKAKKDEDMEFHDVGIGDVLEIKTKDIKEKYTQPPKYFTEDTTD